MNEKHVEYTTHPPSGPLASAAATARQSRVYFCPINGVVHSSRFSYCLEISLPKSLTNAKNVVFFNLGTVRHLEFHLKLKWSLHIRRPPRTSNASAYQIWLHSGNAKLSNQWPNKLSPPVTQGQIYHTPRRWLDETTEVGENIVQSSAIQMNFLDFRYAAHFWKKERVKGDCGEKSTWSIIEATFWTFHPLNN